MNVTIMPESFALIIERHYEPLRRFALSLSRNRSDADDLTQQAFLIAHTHAHQLQDAAKMRAWLSTTLRRLFLQRRRHETRFPKLELSEVEHELPPVVAEFPAQFDATAARAALGALDENFRRPLEMFYLEQRSYRQIALQLRIPLGTVMSRLSRGKRLLRAQLETNSNFACN